MLITMIALTIGKLIQKMTLTKKQEEDDGSDKNLSGNHVCPPPENT